MFAWIRELSGQEKKTLIAAYGGWSVDAFDFMIYTFVIPALIAAWGMSKGQAGLVATSALLMSALGGWLAGALSDRFGRVRVLQDAADELQNLGGPDPLKLRGVGNRTSHAREDRFRPPPGF